MITDESIELINSNLKKPKGFWVIFDNREYAASLCKDKVEYRKKFSGASQISYKCSHEIDILFPNSTKYIPKNHWNNYENSKNESLKYKDRTEFYKCSYRCYEYCRKNNWLDEFFPEKNLTYKDVTLELVIKAAKECINNKEKFHTNFGVYNKAAKLNGWMNIVDEIIGTRKMTKPDFITKEMAALEASKYSTRSEFKFNNGPFYRKSIKMGWIDEICEDYTPVGHEYSRAIYVYEFSKSKTCYVGLTCNFQRRKFNHAKSGPVFEYIKTTGESYIFKELTEFVEVNDARSLESYYIDKYKNDAWCVLNTAKPGGIGYGRKKVYTKEGCADEAKKYNLKSEFIENNYMTYRYILSNKWSNELFSHMSDFKLHRDELTYEQCLEKSKLCINKTTFCEKFQIYYKKSIEEGWIKDFYNKEEYKPFQYWYEFENRKIAASECSGRGDYRNKYGKAYHITIKTEGEIDLFFPIYERKIKLTNLDSGNIEIFKTKAELMKSHPEFGCGSVNKCLKGIKPTYLNHLIQYLE